MRDLIERRQLTDFEIAERLFRAEHPRMCPFSPYERQLELRDLWPVDQHEYVRRVALLRSIQKQDNEDAG